MDTGKNGKVLYKIDSSPPARAVMMIIDILNMDVKQTDLNPVLREQDAPIFKKKNPMKTIPIYEEGDFSLGDSHAIMLYLIDKYANPEQMYLYPSDKRKRATVTQRLFFDCGILFPRLRSVMGPTYAGKLKELSKSMIKNIDDAYEMMEYYLSDTLYLADDVVTLADISAITTISSLHGLHPVDGKRFPKLKKWILNMNEKDFCKRINTPGSEDHVAVLKAFMENARNIHSKL